MDLQKEILNLNQYACRKILTLPSQINKMQADNDEKLKRFFSYLSQKNKKFNSSIDVLHPNFIKYLIEKNICTINRRNNYCFLENNNNERITISKQNWFGYSIVELLRKSNKKYFKKFFDKDGYIINLHIEKWSKSWNGIKRFRRIDFLFDIGDEYNERYIAIEYLENHHIDEVRNQNQYQTLRIVDILFGEYKDKIGHFLFVWDKLWNNDDYQQKILKNFYKKVKDFNNIDNEEKYITSILNEDLHNKKMSKLIFDSYKNENNCILSLNKIEKLFNITNSKNVRCKFMDIVSKFSKSDDSEMMFDFDSDSDIEGNDDDINYFIKKEDDILLSNKGLMSYLKETNLDDCKNIISYRMIHEFPDRLGRSAYNSAKKIMNLHLKLKNELIYGLEDIL